jgi:hypothetical protein
MQRRIVCGCTALESLLALPTKARMLCFRFIKGYSSLRDFGPWVIIGLFSYEDFWKMIFWLVLKLEITYRVYDILKDFDFF